MSSLSALASPIQIHFVQMSSDQKFEEMVQKSILDIQTFAEKNQLNSPADFVEEATVYGTKESFDEMIKLSPGWPAGTQVPRNYVGFGENEKFYIISWNAYQIIHPEDSISDYQKLITHELTHLFHVAYLNRNENLMGPMWFYEGFACLVANQYPDFPAPTSDQITGILKESNRGDYKSYVSLMRILSQHVSVPELLQQASHTDFNKFVETKLKENIK